MTSAPRILVVEDSPCQLLQIQMILEAAGYDVATAVDGQEAIEVIRCDKFDLIVTDLEMPRMDGLQLVRALFSQDLDVAVIVTTATGSELLAAETLQAGAASYVPKDSIASILVPTVARILELKQAAQPDPRLASCLQNVEVEWRLDNNLKLVPNLIRRVESVLSELGICDSSARLQVAMALDEALVNAMVHGNLEVSSDLRRIDEGQPYVQQIQERQAIAPYNQRRVTFGLQANRSTAKFTICDEGPGFCVAEVVDPTDPAHLEKEGGRGLLLINTFMDQVIHNDCGNKIVMVKHCQKDEPRQI